MNSTESTTRHRVAIVNAMLVTPFRMAYEECVLIENGKIAQIGSRDKLGLSDDTQVIDVDGMMVTPGFIDLHIHGAMGRSFNEADRSAFDTISEFFISHGTTLLLATLYLDERKQFLKTISELSRYCKEDIGSTVLGIHLEGPFINKNMKGALNENYIVKPSVEEWGVLQNAGNGYIKMITIAPELEGSA